MADTQLKPFQIRNLHAYPAEENLYDSSTESVISTSPAEDTRIRRSSPIHLSAGEYDKIVSECPNGALTYIDDDDGDLITVGSSLELEQRLEEPSQYEAIVSPNPDPAPIHLFDIRRRRSIIKLWKDIESNSRVRWAQPKYPELEDKSTKELGESSKPSDDTNPTLDSRGLDVSESTDLRQRWLDACRPPRLSSREDLTKAVPSPALNASERSSPTIMSLLAITDEGRRQAEEAGSRIRSMWNAPTSISQAAPDFIRNQKNPWAASVEPATDDSQKNHASESQPSKVEASSQPLLTAFEAEMAKILEKSREPEIDTNDTGSSTANDASNATATPEPQTPRPEPMEQIWPVNLVTGVLQAVAEGIENMGSELKTRIPEVERHLANAQRTIPEDIGSKLQTALSAFESQIHNFATVVQQASDASGEAAERVRQADLQSTEQMLNGVGEMAHEFEDFGKTLFAAFEAEFGQRSDINNATVSNSATETHNAQSQTQEETSSSAKADLPRESLKSALEAAASAASRCPVPVAPISPDVPESSLSEVENSTSQVPLPVINSKSVQNDRSNPEMASVPPRESLLSEIRSKAPPQTSLLPEIISRATNQDPLHPRIKSRVTQHESISSEIRSRAMQNDQSQTQRQAETTLFSNWPNRPAITLPRKAAVTEQQTIDVDQKLGPSHTSVFPKTSLKSTATGPPVPPKAANDVNDESKLRATAHSIVPQGISNGRPADTSRALFMGNIGFEVTEQVLQEVFACHLFIPRIHLPIDSSTGKHAGFGYAHFSSPTSAKAALEQLQGVVIDGHSLNLEYCDNFPIDDLQTQARPNDGLPSVFSGNARGTNARSSQLREAQRSSPNPSDHPEETPEFAARYPSLLPNSNSQETPLAVPARSMTLSPNSQMARFPPVSQFDAHLLANNQRQDSIISHGPTGPHGATGLQREEVRRPVDEHRQRKPRRVASTINRGSNGQFGDSAHALRRRATEANLLRRRAHENTLRASRPVSIHETPTASIPGSFPADESPVPVANNGESSTDKDLQYAMRQSLVDQCVDHLMRLGYGTYIDGGRDRLRIIAEAANLQLPDAIDMIEEERTAYQRYTPNS